MVFTTLSGHTVSQRATSWVDTVSLLLLLHQFMSAISNNLPMFYL